MNDKIDPELRDDREEVANDVEPITLPEYDETLFELPEDYEYVEGGDENGSQD